MRLVLVASLAALTLCGPAAAAGYFPKTAPAHARETLVKDGFPDGWIRCSGVGATGRGYLRVRCDFQQKRLSTLQVGVRRFEWRLTPTGTTLFYCSPIGSLTVTRC